MEHPAAVRVLAGQFDDNVQSIAINLRCSQCRNATNGSEELGSRERMELLDNLLIGACIRNTPSDERSVRRSRSTSRSLDRNAIAGQPAREDLETDVECVPHPRRCHQLQNRGNCGRFIPGLTLAENEAQYSDQNQRNRRKFHAFSLLTSSHCRISNSNHL